MENVSKGYDVNIYIETTWKGPARKDGAAAWLVEYKRNGEPITREGILILENATESRAVLEAVNTAVNILTKPCRLLIRTRCENIVYSVKNNWIGHWIADGWRSAKGKPVRNADQWREMLKALEKHTYTIEAGPHEYQSYMQDKIARILKKENVKEHHTK